MLLTLNPSPQHGTPGPPQHSRSCPSVPTLRSPSPSTSDPSMSAAPTRLMGSSLDASSDRLPRSTSRTLPPPDVGFTSMGSATPSQQQLPHPPARRQSSDDAMHYWQARAEEDRRKQEEEKTRQETLRLEQRRVEQSMLRDSLMGGIPPHIIPLIFAGICQGGLPQPVLELTQQYLTQISDARGPHPSDPQSQSRSHSHPSPHAQRPLVHTRQGSHTAPSGPLPATAQHGVPPPPNILLSQNVPPNAGRPHNPQPLGGPSTPSGPPDSRHAMNSWSNTVSPSQAQPGSISMGNVHYAPGSSIPAGPARNRPGSRSRRSPQSLYFHHWVPPAQPGAPAPGKPHQELHTASNNLRRSEPQASPGRKRKAPGPHQPAPAPSSLPPESLSGSSQMSRPGSPRSDGQHEGRLRHQHYPSDTPVSHGTPTGYVKAEESGRISPTPIASRTTNSLRHSSAQFKTNGFANEPHDSDPESNSQHSPTSETLQPSARLGDTDRGPS
ncbi:hypothetical protein BJX63DRAFT_162369 [Aspergillus granulosus]|uniref:Uncharacterized protein n=1 Tax=Aspergillus granulosus TaxID=176169 RepID=A0ABR4HJB0_9EURO